MNVQRLPIDGLASLAEFRRGLRAFSGVVCVLALASILLALAAFYVASTPLRILTVAIQMAVFAYMALVSDNWRMKVLSLTLFALTLPFAAANAGVSDLKSLLVPCCFLGAIGCAWFTLEFRLSWVVYELPFYCYLFLTLVLVAVFHYGPEEFNTFYAGIGRNGYAAILLAMTSGYIISRALRGLAPSVWLTGLAFLCSIPLYGRSSIVALAMLLVAVVIRRRSAWLIALTLLAVAAVVYASIKFDALTSATNFGSGLESDRWGILDEYFSLVNPQSATFGVNFLDVQAVQNNNGTAENAFLRLHSYTGLGALLFIAVFALSAIELFVRRAFLLLTVLAAIAFRAFADIIILFGTVDLFFMPVLFYPVFSEYFARAQRGTSRVTA